MIRPDPDKIADLVSVVWPIKPQDISDSAFKVLSSSAKLKIQAYRPQIAHFVWLFVTKTVAQLGKVTLYNASDDSPIVRYPL